MMPLRAFILAAGYGKRLAPYTDTRPKPLAMVAGQSLIERTLNQLDQAGVRQVVINTHYLADMVTAHLRSRRSPAMAFSHEETLLDTGGGIRKMVKHFGEQPFFVLSGDGLWKDDPQAPALQALAEAWDPAVMDILILLQPVSSMKLTEGVGDYDIDENGRASRADDQSGAYMFTSMRINAPGIFEGTPEGAPFSYLDLLDTAQQKGRLFGVVHKGDWHHISTPADLEAVKAAFEKRDKTE